LADQCSGKRLAAIDNACAKVLAKLSGRAPDRSEVTQIQIRLPERLVAVLSREAKIRHCSVDRVLEKILEEWLRETGRGGPG